MDGKRCAVRLARMLVLLLVAGPHLAREAPAASGKAAAQAADQPAALDRSGKQRAGKASYYGGRKFAGKKMANGKPMDPRSNGAASKTLPLGTKARVTNQETGKSAEVVIKDRGPYVRGRIIDVTPSTAEKLEMKEDGVAPVVVEPLRLPPKADRGAQRDQISK